MNVGLTRSINRLHAEFSFLLSRFGHYRVRHLPCFASVEPAHCCQLRCPDCALGAGQTTSGGLMSLDTFRRILPKLSPYIHTLQFYFQGEPLLNPDLPAMIALAHEQHLYTIVSTNAQALTPRLAKQLAEAGLNRIIVSIDGFSQESYEQYRVGGSLHKAMAGLQYLRDAQRGHQPWIELQVLRLRSNEHEWSYVRHHYRAMGANQLTFKTAQFIDFEHGNPLMPSDSRFSRYEKLDTGHYQLKPKHPTPLLPSSSTPLLPCRRLWTGCVITTTGDVLPCCYDKGAQYAFGNLLQEDLATIFHSPRAHAFRQAVLSSRPFPICHNCWE